jgi:hypothetical protein
VSKEGFLVWWTDFDFKQETLNYWKQLNHVLKYFGVEENPRARLPENFIGGFLEVRFARSEFEVLR